MSTESNTLTVHSDPTGGYVQAAVQTFEGIQKLAELMAKMGTMPTHLAGKPADCFRIVVQAAKWRMDPFAVAECTSLVHGRMCYEGKLVAAVLQSMGAIDGRLDYVISGKGQESSIVVTGTPRGAKPCSLTGTVKDWRTVTKKDGNTIPNAWDKDPASMLVYRGTRQWARLYAPEAILGVYTPDELEETTLREVEHILPDPKTPKEREIPAAPVVVENPAAVASPAATDPATGTADQQEIAPLAPTLKDVDTAARALAKDFNGKATAELKGICGKLGVAKLSDTPADLIPQAMNLLKHARTALQAGV